MSWHSNVKVHSLSCDAGLRKVTDDMKTHKNPELRASSVVKASSKPATSSAPKAATPAVKKPPVCELQGKKWVVVSVLSLGLVIWTHLLLLPTRNTKKGTQDLVSQTHLPNSQSMCFAATSRLSAFLEK